MKNFNGNVLFLDRSDINTDEIIPAKYLTEIKRPALAPYLLEDLSLDWFHPKSDIEDKSIIITRANFGCGSSREHAPWALEANKIHLVIAESFARIFKQNMFNCGMMAIELPVDTINRIFNVYSQHETFIETDMDHSKLHIKKHGQKEEVAFSISAFERALVDAGGWLEYAESKY